MRIALWIGVALAIAPACKKERMEPVEVGFECALGRRCTAGTRCFRGVCASAAMIEQALNEQSGVDPSPERSALGGDRVRVRTTHGENRIFAACGPTERLVGGGCKGGERCLGQACDEHLSSWPGQFAEDDTVGARWYCSGEGTLQAYALCQEARAPAASPVDAGVVDAAP